MRETRFFLNKNKQAKFAGITSSARGYHLLEDQGQLNPELQSSDVDHSED